MSIAFKHPHNFFYKSGLMSYYSFSDILNMGKAGADVFGTLNQGAFYNSPDRYQEAATSAGEIGNIATLAGLNAYWLGRDAMAGMSPKGPQFTVLADGNSTPIKGGAVEGGQFFKNKRHWWGGRKIDGDFMPEDTVTGKFKIGEDLKTLDELKATAKKEGLIFKQGYMRRGIPGSSGRWGTNVFKKNHGFVGTTLTMAGLFLAGHAIKKSFGLAGKIVDYANNDYYQYRQHYYDKRFFPGTQYSEQNAYQHIGAAMQQTQMNLNFISTARLYHSQG